MRIYCAGKTQTYFKVRRIQRLAQAFGHTITHDWCAVIEKEGGDVTEVAITPEKRRKYAEADLLGVAAAELLIAVGHPHLTGTLWECGAAAVRGIPIWLVDWESSRVSVFEDLPNVSKVTSHSLGERLWQGSPSQRMGTSEGVAKSIGEGFLKGYRVAGL